MKRPVIVSRTRLVAALTALILLAHAMPAPVVGTEPAQAFSVCSVPLINVACDLVSGATNGLKWTFDKATGAIRNAVTHKLIATVSKLACTAAVGAATDGVALAAGAAICATVGSKLIGMLTGSGKSSAAGNGGAPPGGTTTPQTGGASDPNPPDSPANAFRTSGMAAAAAFFAGSAAHLLVHGQSVDLHAGWFQSLFGRVVGVGAILFAALGLLATLMIAVPRGDSEMVREGFKGLAVGVAVAFSAVGIVALALTGVDEASLAVGGSNLHDANVMMKVFAGLLLVLSAAAKTASGTGHSTVASLLGTPAWFLSLGALVGTGLMLLDLAVRNLAVYLALLFLPLAAAARTFPPLRSWSRHLIRFLAAVIAMPLFLVIAVSMASAMILHGGVSGILYGTLLVLIIGFAPFLLFALIGIVDHQVFHGRAVARAGMAAAGAVSARDMVAERRRELAGRSSPSGPVPAPAPAAAAAGGQTVNMNGGGGMGRNGRQEPSRRGGFASDLARERYERARGAQAREARDEMQRERMGVNQDFATDMREARDALARRQAESTTSEQEE